MVICIRDFSQQQLFITVFEYHAGAEHGRLHFIAGYGNI